MQIDQLKDSDIFRTYLIDQHVDKEKFAVILNVMDNKYEI